MHMMSRKDLNSAELDTVRVSRNPTMVFTVNGEVQTNEEAKVHVYDLDLFVTLQILEDTPAVLSPGKLCEDHGYSYVWTSGQKNIPFFKGIKILCNRENYVPIVVPGLSTGSSSSTASTSPASLTQHSTDDSTSSPKTAVQFLETSCKILQKPNTKMKIRTPIRYRETCCAIRQNGWRTSQKIEWTKECQRQGTHPQTLLMHQIRNSKKSGIGEHSIFTHFPKDRNCDVCKRTKMTRAHCRKHTGEAVPRAENFGGLITADHKVLTEGW